MTQTWNLLIDGPRLAVVGGFIYSKVASVEEGGMGLSLQKMIGTGCVRTQEAVSCTSSWRQLRGRRLTRRDGKGTIYGTTAAREQLHTVRFTQVYEVAL
jgi:hypothetical protein